MTKQATEIGELGTVLLDNIKTSGTNQIFRDADNFKPTDPEMRELIDSIRQHGIIQPITLRPDLNNVGTFILVAGERRFRAVKHLQKEIDLNAIPAYIREISEEQAFEMQVVENLQRKDPHPMREAKAFQYYQDTYKLTTRQLADKFAVGETYVLQRLRLGALVPKAQRDFLDGRMTLGHALVLAQLQKAEQEEALNELSRGSGATRYYDTVRELEEFIDQEIGHDIKHAPFDTKDAALFDKAGACTTCPKRTDVQANLFASDARDKKASCLDPACWNMKRDLAALAKVKQLLEDQPETIFLLADTSEDPLPLITKLLKDAGNEPLKEGKDYQPNNGYDKFKKKGRGLVISGHDTGKVITVYLAGSSQGASAPTVGESQPKPADMTAAERKDAIERMRERSKRNKELDAEKVWTRTARLLAEEEYQDQARQDQGGHVVSWKDVKPPKGKPGKAELALIRYQLFKQDDDVTDQLEGWNQTAGQARKAAEKFAKLTDTDLVRSFRTLVRRGQWADSGSMNGTVIGRSVTSVEAQLMIAVAREWGVPVERFEKEQKEIQERRDGRMNERIAAMQTVGKKNKKSKKAKGGKKA